MKRASRLALVTAAALVALLSTVAGQVGGAARADTPQVEPESAERTARDVVDSLGLDRHDRDQQQTPDAAPSASPFAAVGQVLAYVLVAAAAAGLAYAIFAIVRNLSRRQRPDDEAGDHGVEVETGSAAEERIDALAASQWRERAAAAEAEGRYADAVRFLHYAGLLGLDEDGLVPYDPGRANGDYVRVLAGLVPGPAPEDLRGLNRLMEDATFGKHPMDPDAVSRSRSGWTRVHDAFAVGARA